MVRESRNLESALRTNPCQSSAERSRAFSIVSIMRSEYLHRYQYVFLFPGKSRVAQKSDEGGHPHETHLCLL